MKEAVFYIGVASIGSVICDIDVSKSDSRNKLNHVVLFMLFAFIALLCIENYFHVGIIDYIRNDNNLYRMWSGFILGIAVCILGIRTPHRSFMHSIPGMCCIGFATYLISPSALAPMLVAMTSHILIDMLNHKKVRILYPLKSGIALGLCKSDGVINTALFVLGILGTTYYVMLHFFHFQF